MKNPKYVPPFDHFGEAISYRGKSIKVCGMLVETPKRSADGKHHFVNPLTGKNCIVKRDDVAAAIEIVYGVTFYTPGILPDEQIDRFRLFIMQNDINAYVTLID